MNKHLSKDLNRRAFIRQATGLGALLLGTNVTSLSGAVPAAHQIVDMSKVGVQLYTMRDLMKDDFEGTIENVVKIGYKQLEFAGYYDRTPEQVRQLLDRLGATTPSTHVGIEKLRADQEGELSAAQIVGHKYVTVPALPGGFQNQIKLDDWKSYADEFNKLGMACKEKGLKLAYHNHSFEFAAVGDTNGQEILLKETDPELVSFELDLLWTVLGDQDPVEWFERFPGRFKMWHVKDIKNLDAVKAAVKAGGRDSFRAIHSNMSSVGEGDIDFARIFAVAEKSGLEFPIVENDSPKEGIKDIEVSYAAMKKLIAN